jgi:hypothetical protein
VSLIKGTVHGDQNARNCHVSQKSIGERVLKGKKKKRRERERE